MAGKSWQMGGRVIPTSSDVLYNVEFHGSAIYNSATETFEGWNQTNAKNVE